MRPIAPRTGAPEIMVAENQEQYMPLAVALYRFYGGDVAGALGRLTRWTLNTEERAAIANGEDIFVMQLAFDDDQPMTPLLVRAGPGDFVVDPPTE